MHLVCTLIALAVVSVVLLQLVDARHVLFERTRVPGDWLVLRRALSSEPVHFTIGLRSATVDEMAATFWSISTPTSDSYLQLLTREQIEQRFGAKPEHRTSVQQWLAANGVKDSEMRHVSSAIEVDTRVEVVERLFATDMRVFQHRQSGQQVVKAWGSAELPDDIHPVVELVTGLSSFPVPRRSPIRRSQHSFVTSTSSASDVFIPQTLRNVYAIRPQQSNSSEVRQGLIEFDYQSFNNNDTVTFANLVGYNSSNATIQLIPDERIVGPNNDTRTRPEGAIDVQWLSSTNLEAQTWFWMEANENWMYEYALHALNSTVTLHVVSISFGEWEGAQCSIMDQAVCDLLDIDNQQYMAVVNALLMKLGMLGTSIVVASGDDGAHSDLDEQCSAIQLQPMYPATSPYVTSVGATMLVDVTFSDFGGLDICDPNRQFHCIESGREVAVSHLGAGFASGGGFSNSTNGTRPAYQDTVVQAYLNSGVDLPPSSYYNAQGRAQPDVAALGNLGIIYDRSEGGIILEGGTSQASPIFAGVASLLIEIALNKTGKPLGFLNPLLYHMAAQAPDTFHDIVDGDNLCSRDYCGPECKGFVAAKGWDPVTGLGSPNAAKMEAYVNQLLDELLVKRAQPVTTTNDADVAAVATNTLSTADSRYYRRQPTTPTIESLLAAQNSSRRLQGQAQQRHSRPSAFGVDPDEVWQGLSPLAIGVIDAQTLAVRLPTSILLLDTQSLSVTSTCPIDPSLELAGLVTASPYLELLLIDNILDVVYLNGINASTCTTTTSATLMFNTTVTLLAVDSMGETALISDGSTQAVLVDTSSGKQVAVYANETWSRVVSGAINPANSDVWVAWVVQTPTTILSGVNVYSGTSVRFTLQLLSSSLVLDVAIDVAGQYAYVLYATLARNAAQSFIEQIDASNGSSITRWTLPAELPPTTAITACTESGEVWYMSDSQLVRISNAGFTSSQAGAPPIPSPSDVAVIGDGHVLVAENRYSQVEVFNQWGNVVGRYPPMLADCSGPVPLFAIAVDQNDKVYMPLCNSTILIFDADGTVVAYVPTGSHSVPRSVSPGPGQTVFFTDDNNPHAVLQVNRDGTVVNTFTTANTGWLFTVKYNWRANSIYVTDILNSVIYQWAINGTGKPSVIDVGDAVGDPAAKVWSLAIDHHHSQLIVSAELVSIEAGALLWFDMDGTLLAKNYTFPVGTEATGVAVSYDGSRVYATDLFNSAVYVFYQDEQTIQRVERRGGGKTTAHVALD